MAVDEKAISANIDTTINQTAEAFKSFRAFWDLVGNDTHNFLIAAGILGTAILIRMALMQFIYKPITDNIQRKHPEREAKSIHILNGPIQRIPFMIGLVIVAEYLNLQGPARIFVYHCVYTLIIISIFWLLFNLAGQMHVLQRPYPKLFRPQIVHWVSPLLRVLLVATGLMNILQVWGIQVVGLLAGIGIFGLAFALGAQSLVANFLAGFNIVSENHFQLGDFITIDGVAEGHVQDIGFRTTKLKNMDMASIYIPNKTISERPMINNFARSYRRIFWKFTLDHINKNDDIENMIKELWAYVTDSGNFVIKADIPTFIGLGEIKKEGMILIIDCFTNKNDRILYQMVLHELAMNTRRIIDDNNVLYAHDKQDLYVKENPTP